MTAPRVLTFRWQPATQFAPANIDVRLAITEGGGAVFFAEDICRALGLEIDASRYHTPDGMPVIRRIYPGHPTFGFDLVDNDSDPIPVYTTDEVQALAGGVWYTFAKDFITWVDTILTGLGVPTVADTDLQQPEPPASSCDTSAQTFSIALASKYLSRDPQINLGRDILFQTMRSFGWLTRELEVWIPTEAQLTAGTLVRDRTRSRRHREAYPQVRVTAAGMRALHRSLGGIAPLNLEDDTQLSLVDV